MVLYKILWKRSAEKDLKNIPQKLIKGSTSTSSSEDNWFCESLSIFPPHSLRVRGSYLTPQASSWAVLSRVKISSTQSVIARRPTVFWLDDVAISLGSSLLFFLHCKSIIGHDKSSLYKRFKKAVILNPLLFSFFSPSPPHYLRARGSHLTPQVSSWGFAFRICEDLIFPSFSITPIPQKFKNQDLTLRIIKARL